MSLPYMLILIFAVIGIFNTVYLSIHAITKTPVACLFFPKEWCKKVQYSKYSKTMGVPNGVAGLFMYTIILVLSLLAFQGVLSFWYPAAVITFGFLFSMYFVYVQAFVLKAFCTWCVVSALDFVVLFVSALIIVLA